MEKIWLHYDQAALDAAYDQRVWAPDSAEWVARYAADTAAARAAHPPEVHDYGAGLLDLYRAPRNTRGTHLHVHGGAWRALTRADAGMAAPALLAAGWDMAVPDFRLLPEYRLPDMVEDVVAACRWAAARGPLHLSGHSSGAHVAAVAATRVRCASVTLISGLYDLRPALLSARGAYVKLSEDEAHALSAIHHHGRIEAPVILAHGDGESPEFVRQTQEFGEAIGVAPIVLTGTNHFAAAYALASGPVHEAMLALS